MKIDTKHIGWLLIGLQGAILTWLNLRSHLDVFSQMVLIPILLICGLALMTMRQHDE